MSTPIPISVTCPSYSSPHLSKEGYADAQASLWPRGWFGDSARTEGGIAHQIAVGLAFALGTQDTNLQVVRVASRLPSSVGLAIDTYAFDFFAANLPRQAGELDPDYIARIEANLSAHKSTRPGEIVLGNLYGSTFINEPWRTVETGAWDTDGVFAWDSVGGWGQDEPGFWVYIVTGTTYTTQQKAAIKATIVSGKPAGIAVSVFLVNPTSFVATQL